MTVTNRKMFKRDARDKLRNMGGIMASSAPLIQEVAKYQDAGEVNVGHNFFFDALKKIGLPVDLGGSKNIFVDDPAQLNSSELTKALKRTSPPDLENNLQRIARVLFKRPYDATTGAVADAMEAGLKFVDQNQLTDQSILNVLKGPENGGVSRSAIAGLDIQKQIANSGLPNKEKLMGIAEGLVNLPKDKSVSTIRLDPGKAAAVGQEFVTVDQQGKIITDTKDLPEGIKVTYGEGAQDGTGQFRGDYEREKLARETFEAKKLMQEAEREKEISDVRENEKKIAFNQGMRDPNEKEADPSLIIQKLKGTDGQFRPQTLGVTKQQAETHKALQTGDASGAKKNIEEIMKGGAGAQQAGLKQLIKEFTDNAPEYEGVDKNLVISKIGWAMAAGESPNAVVNIANAMKDGADVLIADDMKKKDFKRQVHLQGLQYGLGEISKMRAEGRAQAREMLKQKFDGDYMVVQGEDGQYKQIFVSNYDRATKGLPKGALTTSFVESMLKKKAAASVLDKELLKSAVVSYSDKGDFVENYTEQVDGIISSTNASELLEGVILKNEKGKMTGFKPVWETALKSAMATIGKDGALPESYNDKAKARDHLKIVFQKLIPLTLGEAQSANSISNKDVDRLADAFLSSDILEGGLFSLLTTPKSVLRQKLQFTLGEFHRQQEGALAKLNDLENNDAVNLFYGMNTATGTPKLLGDYVGAQRQRIQPFLQQGYRNSYLSRQGGVYKLVRPTEKA